MLKKTHRLLLALLIVATPVEAQPAGQPRSEGIVLGSFGLLLGDSSATAAVHLGGGGQRVWPNGLGFVADIGYASAAEEFSAGVGVLSPAVVYYFRSEGTTRPYARGGYTLLFGGGAENLLHFAGGVDHSIRRELALKFEVRDSFFVNHPSYHWLEFMAAAVIGSSR